MHFLSFCGLPGLHEEMKNLTEKGLRLELVSNTIVVDINSMLLTEKKPLKGITPVASMCRSMIEGVKFHHYQIKMKPHYIIQATNIAYVGLWSNFYEKMLVWCHYCIITC